MWYLDVLSKVVTYEWPRQNDSRVPWSIYTIQHSPSPILPSSSLGLPRLLLPSKVSKDEDIKAKSGRTLAPVGYIYIMYLLPAPLLSPTLVNCLHTRPWSLAWENTCLYCTDTPVGTVSLATTWVKSGHVVIPCQGSVRSDSNTCPGYYLCTYVWHVARMLRFWQTLSG